MITTSDIKKLSEVFATKADNNELITRLDAIMGEIRDSREESQALAYRQGVHSDQIERLEQKVFGKSFA